MIPETNFFQIRRGNNLDKKYWRKNSPASHLWGRALRACRGAWDRPSPVLSEASWCRLQRNIGWWLLMVDWSHNEKDITNSKTAALFVGWRTNLHHRCPTWRTSSSSTWTGSPCRSSLQKHWGVQKYIRRAKCVLYIQHAYIEASLLAIDNHFTFFDI